VSEFFGPPSKNLLGHSYEIFNISAESSAQAKSISILLEQIGLRGGVCGHVQKSEAHALGCRSRGESSQ
jgi:UDP-N-acetylenolpyruvoylglucosamine reductase